jgi:hypothetical protein
MPTLIFVIVAMGCLLATSFILRHAQKKGHLKTHQHALIMGGGLFLTSLCSFFAPLLVTNVRFDLVLIVFGCIFSISAGLIAFVVDFFFLFIKRKNNNMN